MLFVATVAALGAVTVRVPQQSECTLSGVPWVIPGTFSSDVVPNLWVHTIATLA